MKKIAFILCIIFILTISLVGCGRNIDTNENKNDGEHTNVNPEKHCVMMFDCSLSESLEELFDGGDCIVIGEVVEELPCISYGYSEPDFEKLDDYVHSDSRFASYIQMSIMTPYRIAVTDVYYTSSEKNIPDIDKTIDINFFGGKFAGYELSVNDELRPNIGSTYIFVIHHKEYNGIDYYFLTSSVQGWAELIENSRDKSLSVNVNELNTLFSDIKSLNELHSLLGDRYNKYY